MGPRYHPYVNVKERSQRSEEYAHYSKLVLEDIYREYTFVSQLKFTEDVNGAAGSGARKRKLSKGKSEGYGFVTMEAQYRF